MSKILLRKVLSELSADAPNLAAVRALIECELQAKPAIKSAKLHKYSACFANHDAHGYCIACHPEGLQIKGLLGDMAPIAEVESRAPDRSEQIERLATCACGCPAEKHEEDEMGNLLACACGCDHFHYQTETDSQQAA